MLTVACYLWFDPRGARNNVYVYGPEHVRALRRQVAAYLTLPHEFVVITDRPQQFSGDDFRAVPMDTRTHLPGTRYAKLATFAPDAADRIGGRILQLDLDTVIVGNLDAIAGRGEDLVLWRNPNYGVPRRARYNTSMVLLKAGSRPEFWTDFDVKRTPAMLAGKWGGTDQAWISHRASSDEAHWTAADGVYGAGRLKDIAPGVGSELPPDARIVFFPGAREPHSPECQAKHPWIAENIL